MPKRKPSAHFAKQAQEAYELSLAGYSYRQIAEKMGVSLATVQRRLELYVKDRVHPKADEYRARQIDRAQIYIRSLWSQVLAGDPKSIAQAIRTEERIAKLLGLDSATQFVVTNTNEDLPEDHLVSRMLAAQAKRAESDRQEDVERAAAGLPALPRSGIVRARAKELEALEQMDSAFQEHTGTEPPSRRRLPWEQDAPKPKAIAPVDEFAADNTFVPHEVQEEAISYADWDKEEMQPKNSPRPRRQSKPAPSNPLLRDSDD